MLFEFTLECIPNNQAIIVRVYSNNTIASGIVCHLYISTELPFLLSVFACLTSIVNYFYHFSE